MPFKTLLLNALLLFSFQSIAQEQLQKDESSSWNCPEFAHQYQFVLKSRMNPNIPNNLCDIIATHQHDSDVVRYPLGTEVYLLIYPKNHAIDHSSKEIGNENN